MCRIAAYAGPAIPLERIIVTPNHSLLEQSQNATEAKLAVNGDGFGVAWYTHQERPGLYRDVLPAWSDGNLTNLCRMVESRLFLAHVRASTVGETSRSNCHPFAFGRWAFMHNGIVGDFPQIRRKLEAKLPDKLYLERRGTTDSELFFLLMLANGLDQDPYAATLQTIRDVTAAQESLSSVNRLTCAFSDGERIYAFRYSSDGHSPTLYIGHDLDSGGCAIVSEPLETNSSRWTAIEDAYFVTLENGKAEYRSLADACVGQSQPGLEQIAE